MGAYKTNSESRCHKCESLLDTATGEKKKPKSGDISICIYCGAIGVFKEDLKIRALTNEEQEHYMNDPAFISSILPAVEYVLSDKNPLRGKKR